MKRCSNQGNSGKICGFGFAFFRLKSRHSAVIDRFLEYAWPDNVRELANMVEREIILNPHGPLTFEYMNPATQSKPSETGEHREPPDNLDEVIRHHIQHVLQKTWGNVHDPGGVAELLEINANTLRNHMNKLGIRYGMKKS